MVFRKTYGTLSAERREQVARYLERFFVEEEFAALLLEPNVGAAPFMDAFVQEKRANKSLALGGAPASDKACVLEEARGLDKGLEEARSLQEAPDEVREFREVLAEPYSVCSAQAEPRSLQEALAHMDAPFSEQLLMLIDAKGLKDSDVYKKAGLTRQNFSKIRSGATAVPQKRTVLALALALELDLETTKELLAHAGYALSHSSKFDLIIEYFIKEEIYDLFEINSALYAFDQPLLTA